MWVDLGGGVVTRGCAVGLETFCQIWRCEEESEGRSSIRMKGIEQ